MNQKIEFKKDCMLKTYVSSITDISLTHDYKILDDTIEGYFDVTGSYKVTMSSVETESFMFTIPFTIALSSLIDRDTIDLKLSDFNYSVEKDVLHLKMFLDMDYQEIEIKEDIEDNEEINNCKNLVVIKNCHKKEISGNHLSERNVRRFQNRPPFCISLGGVLPHILPPFFH